MWFINTTIEKGAQTAKLLLASQKILSIQIFLNSYKL